MKKIISKDGTSLAFDRTGAGPAIILIDGAFCSRTFGPMPKLAPLLASDFTVITYDRRGRGDSGDVQPYAVDREIEDLEALVHEVGGSPYVFGMSSGAALALKAAAAGVNIGKLVLYEPPFMVGSHVRPPVDHHSHLARLIASGQRSEAARYYLVEMIGMPSFIYYIMRLLPMWSKMKAIASSLPYDAAVMGDFHLPEKVLASVNVPARVIAGEKSPALLRDAAKAVASTLRHGEASLLKGQTHNVNVNVLAPAIAEFLKR